MYNENRRVVFEKELQQLIKVNIPKIYETFYWHNIVEDVRSYTETWEECQKQRQRKIAKNGPGPFRCFRRIELAKTKCMLCKIYHFLMKLHNQLRLTFVMFQKVIDLNTWLFAMIISLNALKQRLSLISLHQLSQIFVRGNLPPWEWSGKRILTRELHYPVNWIRLLEINKLCNVIAKDLAFSTNRKLISIIWCPNFSANWKWKWMNCIRHGKKNVVGKQKFQLISEVIHLYKSNQFTCY